MQSKLKWALYIAVILLLASCTSILGEGGREVADALYNNGAITKEQHSALVGDGYDDILRMLINTASTLLIGVPIIHTWRGPATKVENVQKAIAAKA
jgi:hypothetical protein